MAADIRKAAASDSIADTLDYKAVSKRLIDFVGHSEFHLVETIAERLANQVIVNKKGAVRGAMDVGVIIERGERP